MTEAGPGQELGPRHREVDLIRRLLRRSADRAREGRFVVEGPTLLAAALDAAAGIEAVYAAPGASAKAAEVLDRARQAGVPVRQLAPGVLERIADVVTPQGVLAVCRSVTVELTDVPSAGLVLVGVDIGDPGNAGTMIRTADALGAAGVVFVGASVDVTNPKVVRSAAGSIFHLPVVGASRAGTREGGSGGRDEVRGVNVVLDELARGGRRCFGAAARAGRPCDETDLAGDVAVVVGNEAHGLPDGLALDSFVHVPMAGRSESLNVAMAATILCYEAARQRRAHGHA